jgi:spore germination cell wall hydrolase CwlJ-like protein
MYVIAPAIWGALNILAEARGEPYPGQVAVGFVTRERARLRYMSDGSITGTVWAPGQFSWTLSTDKQRLRVLKATEEENAWITAKLAWEDSEGSDLLPAGTVHYYAAWMDTAPGGPPAWAKSPLLEFVRQIGGHKFYRLRQLPAGVPSSEGE